MGGATAVLGGVTGAGVVEMGATNNAAIAVTRIIRVLVARSEAVAYGQSST